MHNFQNCRTVHFRHIYDMTALLFEQQPVLFFVFFGTETIWLWFITLQTDVYVAIGIQEIL